LHFAEWAAQHEVPYLQRPETIEEPTETWAAQDLRKSEVFDYAAQYVIGEKKMQLRERARFFHEYAVNELKSLPTRHYCRPKALTLSLGSIRATFAKNPEGHVHEAREETWGEPPPMFVHQKIRAARRAAACAGVAAVGLATAFFVAA